MAQQNTIFDLALLCDGFEMSKQPIETTFLVCIILVSVRIYPVEISVHFLSLDGLPGRLCAFVSIFLFVQT